MEFLTTYGWAFLVIVGVLGTMAYFGFGNVRDTLPTSCNFGATLECGGFIALENGTFAFEVINREVKAINISTVVCEFPRSDNATRIDFPVTSTTVPRNGVATIICPALVPMQITGKDQYKIKLAYFLNETGALPKVANGEIITGTTVLNDPLFTTYRTDAAAFPPDSVVIWDII